MNAAFAPRSVREPPMLGTVDDVVGDAQARAVVLDANVFVRRAAVNG